MKGGAGIGERSLVVFVVDLDREATSDEMFILHHVLGSEEDAGRKVSTLRLNEELPGWHMLDEIPQRVASGLVDRRYQGVGLDVRNDDTATLDPQLEEEVIVDLAGQAQLSDPIDQGPELCGIPAEAQR